MVDSAHIALISDEIAHVNLTEHNGTSAFALPQRPVHVCLLDQAIDR
jgi:hypothetical protein